MPKVHEVRRGEADLEHAPQQLMDEIMARSEADCWADARLEWALDYVYFVPHDEPGTCLCGHQPIIEHCVLVNRENGNTATVGNVCVTKFMGIESNKLFQALGRIRDNPEAALNAEMIEYVSGKGWITEWERGFYLNTYRKRKLSERQRSKRVEINERILFWVSEAKAATGAGDE